MERLLIHGGTWFTEGKAANFITLGERLDPLLLLLLGAKLQDGPQVEGLWGQRGGVRGLQAQAGPVLSRALLEGPSPEEVRGWS